MSYRSGSRLLTFLVALGLHCCSEAKTYQARGAAQPDEVVSDLMLELTNTFRATAAQNRLEQLEEALRSLYDVVPKNDDGSVEHAVVRYMLHRYFMSRHGWFIKGLEPESEAWNASSPTGALKDWVPAYLSRFLEQLLGANSIHLREVSVLAATLEDLIHKEAIERLKEEYEVMRTPDTGASRSDIEAVIELHVMNYISSFKLNAESREEVATLKERLAENVRNWNATMTWMKDGIFSLMKDQQYDFDGASRFAEEVGEHFHDLNDRECAEMKQALIEMEGKPGRVRLSTFYTKALFGVWNFNEKASYLRTIGALDESDPDDEPHVIVTNYVTSPLNCLQASDFYSICCRSDCESLMGEIEKGVGEPTASPSVIANVVEKLSTPTSPAPQKLSAAVLHRLDEVAETNGGEVPLHGRLFALWLHHVFPRDCPYPHGRGTTNPQTPDEWMAATGSEASATQDEMNTHMEAAKEQIAEKEADQAKSAKKTTRIEECEKGLCDDDEDLPWSLEEELLVIRPQVPKQAPQNKSTQRLFVISVAVLSFFIAMWHYFPRHQQLDDDMCSKDCEGLTEMVEVEPASQAAFVQYAVRMFMLFFVLMAVVYLADFVLDELAIFALTICGFFALKSIQHLVSRRRDAKSDKLKHCC